MQVTIDTRENGFLLSIYHTDGQEMVQRVFQFREDELDTLQEVLYEVIEALGYTGSRYDARRIKVTFEPGDKYEAPNEPVQSGKRKAKKGTI